ncbi:MAG: hopanoid biosynthesis associated glycosyl transferase protein HpnI [Phenylobacterium sp.]|nr:hopanoid biosynthesis associated glycosyl transferase protein HpnI [Phenylobacterium sp.]MDB5436772.1 hopanoid biosynthesis associated glycosyl transferase protein HpnI [Phenylobacterium sp.]MDB5462894.1 hopanoid biosynthesis associated glycosyl transferase protein HpnI [Phenylobacterium sp.]MDB5500092.1 hopanoid biosynthesis associated glycosyl transferase protein HpnI [Phenylobacterium sp.]
MVLALAGSAYQLLAARQVRALLVQPRARRKTAAPAVTILKPLHGAEPGLDVALQSFLAQDYPGTVQVVFGVQDPADPAQLVVGSLRRAHPRRDVALVVDATPHGANRKISNVINMMRRAKHDIILLADSDIVVRPDYLREVVAALETPGVGVVTCPYRGQAVRGIWSRLAAMGLTYQFLPSVAVGVGLGLAQPCMGSTIALRREVLTRIGGFEAFADLLADDYAIGAAVRGTGLRSLVAPVLVAHNCTEHGLAELARHELRWARTIRGVDPAGFFGSGVTYAVPLALLGLFLTGASLVSLAVLAFALICRLWLMREVDRIAGVDGRGRWLTPLRDVLSFTIFLGSFFVRAVDWRGTQFRVDAQGALRRI